MEEPNIDPINSVTEWFFAGYIRVTSIERTLERRSEVYNLGLYLFILGLTVIPSVKC